VRLLQTTSPATIATTLAGLLEHPSAGAPTELALDRFRVLFGRRSGVGIEMASHALRGAMPIERVRTICLAYSDALFDFLQ
jgi:hypothetical protein